MKIKGRGAQINVKNRFFTEEYIIEDAFLNYCEVEGESPDNNRTEYIAVHPKTIINKSNMPDMGLMFSMNPYQGCEHGCIYCYARNSHQYWGYSAGLDFERKIMVKKNAADLLDEKLSSKNWKAHNIMLSGNTDCYQPAERKFGITRKILEVFLKHKHPVGIITKNALILRDIDLLQELAKLNLVTVNITLTSLDENIRRVLEPRAVSSKRRLQVINKLSEATVPVSVMMAPIIPAINNYEIFSLLKAVSGAGAYSANYTFVRLNAEIYPVFSDWVKQSFPDRAAKIMNQIKESHKGKLGDRRFGARLAGNGKIAEQIKDTFKLARLKYFQGKSKPGINYDLYELHKNKQFRFF